MSKKQNKKLIIGNWKMNPGSISEAKKIFTSFKRKRIKQTGVTVVFCPPAIYLNDLMRLYLGNRIFFGVQDIFNIDGEGSYTGEISPKMIKSLGARFSIVGHSERRALGETNQEISKKVKTSLESGLHTILCIGELERDNQAEYLHFIKQQLGESLEKVSKKMVEKLIIAYEPVWSIGKGKKPPETHDIEQTVLYIKKILYKKYGKSVAESIPVLYGGSTDDENVHEIVYGANVDGVLVGRSSLNPHIFAKMVEELSRKPVAFKKLKK